MDTITTTNGNKTLIKRNPDCHIKDNQNGFTTVDTQAPVRGHNTPGHTHEAPTVATETPTRELNTHQGHTTTEPGTIYQITTPTTNKKNHISANISTSSSSIHNYSYTPTYPKNYPKPPSSLPCKSYKRLNCPYLGKIRLQHLNVRSFFLYKKFTNFKVIFWKIIKLIFSSLVSHGSQIG